MKISKRMEAAPMSGIRKMFDLAGSDSVNLSLGEPDIAPPEDVIKGLVKAVWEGKNGYGPTPGIMPLRDAIAQRYNNGTTGSNVLITNSGTTALMTVAQALLDPGDETLVPSPGFVVYAPQTILSSGKPIEYKLTDGDFQPDIDDILNKINSRTKLLYLNYPSNPTGGVLSERSFNAICDISEDHGITVVSDEVYEPFVYEGKHKTFSSKLDNSVVVNGFSKMMSITGWRMGFIVADKNVLQELTKMSYHMSACPNTPSQFAILDAITGVDAYLDKVRNIYRKRRDFITDRINSIDGFRMEPPKGAFYAFPSFDFKKSSEEFAMELVKEGLICVPGSAFGKYGEGHLRFSYAADEQKISKGMDILEKVSAKIR